MADENWTPQVGDWVVLNEKGNTTKFLVIAFDGENIILPSGGRIYNCGTCPSHSLLPCPIDEIPDCALKREIEALKRMVEMQKEAIRTFPRARERLKE